MEWLPSDDSIIDASVSTLSALFFLVFGGGLNDSCLISSNALNLPSFHDHVTLRWAMPHVYIYTWRSSDATLWKHEDNCFGCWGTKRVTLYPPPLRQTSSVSIHQCSKTSLLTWHLLIIKWHWFCHLVVFKVRKIPRHWPQTSTKGRYRCLINCFLCK